MGEHTERDETDGHHTETGARAPARMADDRLYRALAATPRRRILSYLVEHEDSTVDELASMLVGWDTTERGGMADGNDYQRMTTELCHTHLPMLVDAELVTYDRERGTVAIEDLEAAITDLIALSISAERE